MRITLRIVVEIKPRNTTRNPGVSLVLCTATSRYPIFPNRDIKDQH